MKHGPINIRLLLLSLLSGRPTYITPQYTDNCHRQFTCLIVNTRNNADAETNSHIVLEKCQGTTPWSFPLDGTSVKGPIYTCMYIYIWAFDIYIYIYIYIYILIGIVLR